MVRSGESSSRELVEISLERIEELNPELNAFVEVDGERRSARARMGSGPVTSARSPVCRAIKNNRPVEGMRLTYGCELMAEHCVATTTT